MQTQTFRAGSMQEALQMVRHTLGPDAAVLQTREVPRGILQWLTGPPEIEVVASAEVGVPSRFPSADPAVPTAVRRRAAPVRDETHDEADQSWSGTAGRTWDYRARFRENLRFEFEAGRSLVEELATVTPPRPEPPPPDPFDMLLTDLLNADFGEDVARDLVQRLRHDAPGGERTDRLLLKARLARLIEEELRVCGPISIQPPQTRTVALVGPTGVGKTTTIAKLAAIHRLRERQRVGLITVDTYRIAAVDQLRTYAEIIDVPMEVVSTPRQLRTAVDRLSGLDLVLIDTAGRSPHDAIRLQELKALLAEARADEVHLVLSCVASLASLKRSAQQFAPVGVSALVLTKLDEAAQLGSLLALLRACRLPLSYVTHGQNVPDDIEPAEAKKLTRRMLGVA